jgi:hypothetical protein
MHHYLMAATNKRLLISESCDNPNRCTPYRGKLDQHDMYAFSRQSTYARHTLPQFTYMATIRVVVNNVGQILLLLRISAPGATLSPTE